MSGTPCAIIGSGNIGTDLMLKILRPGSRLRLVAMSGIDSASEGLALARRHGVAVTSAGIDGLLDLLHSAPAAIVFDATSARAHAVHHERLKHAGVRLIDLTPAATGPYVVPVVNPEVLDDGEYDINMVTCGGQATVPIVAAIGAVAPVRYAEIVASIASRSAGPGTRANIDEFTQTTARALENVAGAERGRAIIVLNPAEPPLLMRNTVYTLSDAADENAVASAVERMAERIRRYVPGYRLRQTVQFERFDSRSPLHIPEIGEVTGLKATVFIEVEGAGDYLPAYAGNLDIMTSAAVEAARRIAGAL